MKPVHVNPHQVKKSKELDDNNLNKNDRKDPKTIAALVNEGRFSYPYILTGVYAEIRSLSNSQVGKNAEFRENHEYYWTRRKNPLKNMQSVVEVACKILRVFYTILTKGVNYDPRKLIGDIKRSQMQAE